MSMTEQGPSIRETMIAWTPADETDRETCGQIALIPWPDSRDKSGAYSMTTGACEFRVQRFAPTQAGLYVLSNALAIIIADGLDPAGVHRALWPLREYRGALPADTPAPEGVRDYGAYADPCDPTGAIV